MRKEINIDWLTILLYLLIVLLGWLNMYAVSGEGSEGVLDLKTYHGRQLLFILISIGLGIVILVLDTKFIEFLSYVIYGVSMVSLVAVLIFAAKTKGATSWFQIGGFSLQPSEFAKVATLLALAKFSFKHNFSLSKTSDALTAGGIVLFPAFVILLQNDAGSALVFFSLIFVFFREGMSPLVLVFIFLSALIGIITIFMAEWALHRYVLIGSLIVLTLSSFYISKWRFPAIHFSLLIYFALIVLSVNLFTKDYHRARIQVLTASEEKIREDKNLQKVAYNLRESLVAIGSGGLTGKGYQNATHTKGDFVPEEHTDYIFCVVGEEHGWMGSTLVLILYFLLILRIFMISENSKSRFARVYGYGVASILFFHIMINVGMTVGLIPTVGIPLPFFSYGGSSMIAFSIMIFILINAYSHRVNVLGAEQ